jgi:hypothetical protein
MYGEEPCSSPLSLPGGRECVLELFSGERRLSLKASAVFRAAFPPSRAFDVKGFCSSPILFSASKSFHLGGFRVGWALGNRRAIASLEELKV